MFWIRCSLFAVRCSLFAVRCSPFAVRFFLASGPVARKRPVRRQSVVHFACCLLVPEAQLRQIDAFPCEPVTASNSP